MDSDEYYDSDDDLFDGFSIAERPVGSLGCYTCCGRVWWGGPRNRQCNRCHRDGADVPFGKRVGLGHFRCECGRTFVGFGRGDVRSKCHGCQRLVLPHAMEPPGQVEAKSSLKHHCELCGGRGRCPLKR